MHQGSPGQRQIEAPVQEFEDNMILSKRRRRMAPETIPHDVLFSEILIRLPVKSLVRFESVCKLWRATIRSAHFIRCHLEQSRATAGSTMVVLPQKFQANFSKSCIRCVNTFCPGQSRVAERIMSKDFPCGIPNFCLPLHCDGLILIPCFNKHIFVCNPTTKEFVELPPGSHSIGKYETVAFGFDPWSATYKVARHFLRYVSGDVTDISGYSTGHEVLTLGDGAESWRWKATIDPPYPIINGRSPLFFLGFVYWSAARSIALDTDRYMTTSDIILRFSMRDGTFTVHPNPPETDFRSNYDRICELGGKLSYAHTPSPREVVIWQAVAEDGPNIAWSRCCCVRLPAPRHLPILACYSADQGKIFLTGDSSWFLFKCDLRDGSLKLIINTALCVSYDHGNDGNTTGTRPNCYYMVPFTESLLRIRPW